MSLFCGRRTCLAFLPSAEPCLFYLAQLLAFKQRPLPASRSPSGQRRTKRSSYLVRFGIGTYLRQKDTKNLADLILFLHWLDCTAQQIFRIRGVLLNIIQPTARSPPSSPGNLKRPLTSHLSFHGVRYGNYLEKVKEYDLFEISAACAAALPREDVVKRILVTGGAGFIGSHLCERLISENHEILCVDNYFTGRRNNVAHLSNGAGFELMRHDVTFPLYVETDEIYNLACPASPQHYQFDPVQTTKTSVHGAINMLGLAKRTNATILQASTSEVYGDPDCHPQVESYNGNVNPIGPRACYDEGKRCAETLFFDYHRQHDLGIKVARIFNTYGPRMLPNDGRVVSNFIVQALKGEEITIYGDGGQTRSFCYVDDLISGLVSLMGSPAPFTGPVNLGNPNETTIIQLAELVLALTKSSSKIIFRPLPQDDPVRRRPDIALAKENLDWQPRVPLEEGLEKTVHYFRSLLDV